MQVQGKLKNLFKKISLLLPFLLCFLLALKEFKLFSWQQTQRIYYPLIGIIILWAFIVIVFLAFKFARIIPLGFSFYDYGTFPVTSI